MTGALIVLGVVIFLLGQPALGAILVGLGVVFSGSRTPYQ